MVDPELARRIVERHALRPGRRIEAVHDEPAGVVVETDTLPLVVRPADPPFGDLQVLEVARGYHVDPPPAPIGVAVGPDGDSFALNDQEGFGAFWAALGGSVEPAVLADLLAAYQSGQYRGRVAGSEREPVSPRRSEQLAGVVGCTPPLAEVSGDAFRLRFCSYTLRPAETGEDWVLVSRWDVEADRGGPIHWSMVPLADLVAD